MLDRVFLEFLCRAQHVLKHVWNHPVQIVTEHKRSMINIENCWSKWQVIASQESIASQIHRESSVSVLNTFDQTQNQFFLELFF